MPQPLGEAFFEARKVIREADLADPTRLASVLYGDPYGQLVPGDAQPRPDRREAAAQAFE
jgi:hypothetical protein